MTHVEDNYRSSSDYWVYSWTSSEELAFLEKLLEHPEPFGMDQHLFFVDSERYGMPKEIVPNWINVVREPVERFASQFVYNRHPKRWVGAFRPNKVRRIEKAVVNAVINVSFFLGVVWQKLFRVRHLGRSRVPVQPRGKILNGTSAHVFLRIFVGVS